MSEQVIPQLETTNLIILAKETLMEKRLALHPIKNGEIQAEIPFTKKSAQAIFSLFNDYQYEPKQFKHFIPKTVLYAKDTPESGIKVLWYNKKEKKHLYFSESTKIKSGFYYLPTLIFKYSKGILSVYATADVNAKNINAKTPLYKAPFYNLYSNGIMCMGNVKLKSVADNLKSFEAVISYLESAFFNSVFTHSNTDSVTSKTISELKEQKIFSYKNLIKTKNNLKDIL